MRKLLFGLLGLLFSISANAACNLLDESQILNTNGFSINENGYYNGSFSDWANVRFSFDNAFKENTQYTLSFNGYVSSNAALFSFSYTDGTGGSCAIRATQATDYTCTTEPNKTLSNISTTYGSGTNNTVYVKNIQLEEGTTATAYVPYHPGCHETNIKVATTKYAETVFNPLNTALQSAISVVDSVVSRTITQAASIATLQSDKQTRPNDIADDSEKCPAYKQCLLVEDEQGVPHWYQITDPFRDFVTPIIANEIAPNNNEAFYDAGYTQLEYIESTGTQYIQDTLPMAITQAVVVDGQYNYNGSSGPMFIAGNASSSWTTQWCMRLNNDSSATIHAGSSSVQPFEYTNNIRQVWTIDLLNSKGYLDGVEKSSFSGFSAPNQNWSYLGTMWNDGIYGATKGQTYNIKVYDNNTLVRNFVPVMDNATGKIGMYDTVGGRFYGNAATSGADFTAGPIVENDADVPAPQWRRAWSANAQYNLSAGEVYGTARCNNLSGTQEQAQTATSAQVSSSGWLENGAMCWCKVVGINVDNEYTEAPATVPWVFGGERSSVADCNKMCAAACSNRMLDNSLIRNRAFGM